LVIGKIHGRDIWIISDRINKADDNGEVFFTYVMAAKPAAKVYFAISKESADYRRLKKIGKVVDCYSRKYRVLFYLSKYFISSQADHQLLFPMIGLDKELNLNRPKFIFLQHGVTKDNISKWINKYNQNIYRIITNSPKESESFQDVGYYYSNNNIWLTGMPRFDRSLKELKKVVVFMPTWRHYLVGKMNDDGTRDLNPGYEKSSFYVNYGALLSDKHLFDEIESYGYTIQVMLHPNMKALADLIPHDERTVFLPFETSYGDIIGSCSLLITDYSSVAFDFAYYYKPVIYFQPDFDEFFSGEHTYTKGYFSYEEDGFGEIETDPGRIIECIIDYCKHDCLMKQKYRNRVDSYFEYHDNKNSERIYNLIAKD